jgi:serine/threonine-protein phosphatase 6 regulatory subunit 3
LCCELEAVYNTLLEETETMKLLFSLLDAPAPLASKVAGYFGRVVGSLLLRKGGEMLQYFQQEGDALLEKLVAHVDTTSVADVVKRMVGADDGTSVLPLPAMSQWLAETPLIDMLLSRLSSSHSSETQANAADILSATAHSQPSPLAMKLAEHACVTTLMTHALAPGKKVLVPALDVCLALLEPQRALLGESIIGSILDSSQQESTAKARSEAASAIVQHLEPLVELLRLEEAGDTKALEVAYGVLTPPLGRHRLKIVELLAALVRSGCSVTTEEPIVRSSALPRCLGLFSAFPFNNLLHHSVASMLISCVSPSSGTTDVMLRHLFEDCALLDWIVQLPQSVVPAPLPGRHEQAAAKTPLRAGYLGHITQVAGALERAAAPSGFSGEEAGTSSAQSAGTSASAKIAYYTAAHEGWIKYVEEVLHPQQELENTSGWACGRPAPQALAGLDSEDDFQVCMWGGSFSIYLNLNMVSLSICHLPFWCTRAINFLLVFTQLTQLPLIPFSSSLKCSMNWIWSRSQGCNSPCIIGEENKA